MRPRTMLALVERVGEIIIVFLGFGGHTHFQVVGLNPGKGIICIRQCGGKGKHWEGNVPSKEGTLATKKEHTVADITDHTKDNFHQHVVVRKHVGIARFLGFKTLNAPGPVVVYFIVDHP